MHAEVKQGLRGAGDPQDGSRGAAGPQIPQTAATRPGRARAASDGLPEAREEVPAAIQVRAGKSLSSRGERAGLRGTRPNGSMEAVGKRSPD